MIANKVLKHFLVKMIFFFALLAVPHNRNEHLFFVCLYRTWFAKNSAYNKDGIKSGTLFKKNTSLFSSNRAFNTSTNFDSELSQPPVKTNFFGHSFTRNRWYLNDKDTCCEITGESKWKFEAAKIEKQVSTAWMTSRKTFSS